MIPTEWLQSVYGSLNGSLQLKSIILAYNTLNQIVYLNCWLLCFILIDFSQQQNYDTNDTCKFTPLCESSYDAQYDSSVQLNMGTCHI